jgi:hypothetical protein
MIERAKIDVTAHELLPGTITYTYRWCGPANAPVHLEYREFNQHRFPWRMRRVPGTYNTVRMSADYVRLDAPFGVVIWVIIGAFAWTRQAVRLFAERCAITATIWGIAKPRHKSFRIG